MEALATLVTLLSQATAAMNAAAAVSQLIQNAKSQGRDVTSDELKQLFLKDDAARDALEQAIKDAEAKQ